MNVDEMRRFVTFYFEVGSALDTRVYVVGSGPVGWEGVIEGPRFSVKAKLNVSLRGAKLVASSRLEVQPGSQVFDLVLGCRLLCPSGKVQRPPYSSLKHVGVGHYHALSDSCRVEWGVYDSHFDCRLKSITTPDQFQWCPYIADEPDGWRIHARAMAKSGDGYRRTWLLNQEITPKCVKSGGAQSVRTEGLAHSPLYRICRSAIYREVTASSVMIFKPGIEIELPGGMLP